MPAIEGISKERNEVKKLSGIFMVAKVITRASTGRVRGSVQGVNWGNANPISIAKEKIKFLFFRNCSMFYSYTWINKVDDKL